MHTALHLNTKFSFFVGIDHACPDISLSVESFDLWVGGTLTVTGAEQEMGACAVTIYNDQVTETLDFGVGNYTTCVAMFNISTTGLYSVDMTCNISTSTPASSTSLPATITPSTSSPFSSYMTYQCPEQRHSCLNGVSLLDDSLKDPNDPLISYASQRLTVSLKQSILKAIQLAGGNIIN